MTGKDDSFEVLLHSVLQEDAEPRAGLEQRILARVRAGQGAPIRNWFLRYAAMAVPVIAIIAFVLFHQNQNKPVDRVLVENKPVVAESLVAAAEPEKRHTVPPKSTVKTTLPKQDVFPAPVPIPAEMRSLAEWAQRDPQEANRLLQWQQADSVKTELKVEPIHIAAIQVSPLPDQP